MKIKHLVPQSLSSYLRWLFYCGKYRSTDIGQGTVISGSCSFGRYTGIRPRAELIEAALGDYSYIGRGAKVSCAEIGRFCSIAADAIIGGFVHPTDEFVSTSPSFFSPTAQCGKTFVSASKFEETRRTIVGSDVWIGYRAIVLPGVVIGHGAIVGAGAVVSRDVAPYAIVGGVPARLIRYRFEPKTIADLLEGRWWDRDDEWLRRNAEVFDSASAVITALKGHGG